MSHSGTEKGFFVRRGILTEKKFTTASFASAKKNGRKITMLTAYDFTMATLLDNAGIDCLLVGDSLGMVELGYDDTLRVTMDDMVRHCAAVSRGAKRALTVGDLPFLSYHVNSDEAVRNAGRIIQEGGMEAVKLEGGMQILDSVKAIVRAQIPVMGHLGLTPQSINVFGGFKVQGRQERVAQRIMDDALALEDAGAFSVVLECIPAELAARISEKLTIPTIGIGAGPDCDGQVLVVDDILGMYDKVKPSFVKQYAEVGRMIGEAAAKYAEEVRTGEFPTKEQSFS